MTNRDRDQVLYFVGVALFAMGLALMGFAYGVTKASQQCQLLMEQALEEQDNLREGRTLLPPATKPAKPRLVV